MKNSPLEVQVSFACCWEQCGEGLLCSWGRKSKKPVKFLGLHKKEEWNYFLCTAQSFFLVPAFIHSENSSKLWCLIWQYLFKFFILLYLLKYIWCSVNLEELVKFHYSCSYEMIGEEESDKPMLPACFNTYVILSWLLNSVYFLTKWFNYFRASLHNSSLVYNICYCRVNPLMVGKFKVHLQLMCKSFIYIF